MSVILFLYDRLRYVYQVSEEAHQLEWIVLNERYELFWFIFKGYFYNISFRVSNTVWI